MLLGRREIVPRPANRPRPTPPGPEAQRAKARRLRRRVRWGNATTSVMCGCDRLRRLEGFRHICAHASRFHDRYSGPLPARLLERQCDRRHRERPPLAAPRQAPRVAFRGGRCKPLNDQVCRFKRSCRESHKLHSVWRRYAAGIRTAVGFGLIFHMLRADLRAPVGGGGGLAHRESESASARAHNDVSSQFMHCARKRSSKQLRRPAGSFFRTRTRDR
jgi:hypothetical protein